MSQYVFLKQANGEFLKVLADDNGVIQYTTNGDSFSDIETGTSAVLTDATLSGDGSLGDPLAVVSAPTATTATGPANAATFSATLAAGNDSITTLGAPASNVDITGLAGNTDGDYEFWFDLIVKTDANNVVSLQPENLATNQSGEVVGSAGNTPFGIDVAIMHIGSNNSGSDLHFIGHGYLTSKSGRNRFFECVAFYTTSVKIQFRTVVVWTGTATAITKLRFNASAGFDTGSYVRLRRMRNVT